MKLKDVLELTQTEPLDVIAKTRLTIGKNAARDALKAAGCIAKNGVRGWFYEGDPARLEQSIYDFAATSQQKASPRKQIASKKESEQLSTAKPKESKSDLDAIDRLLLQNDDSSQQRVYRGFYWDSKIIDFIDSVKHGNKSDLMNEIVKAVLKNKGLI